MALKKNIPNLLFVHLDRTWGTERVGQLEFDDHAAGGFSARFRYADSWLRHPRRIPLDPLNLPLTDQWVSTGSKYVHLGVLFDAGPDMWGRRVLQSQADDRNVEPSEQEALLMGRGNGVGALLFSTSPALPEQALPAYSALPSLELDLERVHQASARIFMDQPLPESLQGVLAGSWSMGGARAKAVMRDAEGEIWIAKFSEPGDKLDRQRMEYANLEMARAIGMNVPQLMLRDTSLGSVLLIKRFDRTRDHHRLHYASGIALISAEPEDKRLLSQRDQAIFSYARLADIIGKVAPDPQRDRKELFARMVLNVALHNTDDHLKNIGFLESGDHLELSPLFDVVTQPSPHHFLRIGTQGRVGNFENALSEPRRFGLTAKGAQSILDIAVDVVRQRHDFYRQAGMPEKDREVLEAIVSKRLPP